MKKALALFTMTVVSAACTLTAFADSTTMPDKDAFDAEYYAQQNPDVVATLGTDAELLYQHYIIYGKSEGRLPYEQAGTLNTPGTTITLTDGTLFDPAYYARNNADVVAAVGMDANALAQHYVHFGKAEGRKPAVSQDTLNTEVGSELKGSDAEYARFQFYIEKCLSTGGYDDYEVGRTVDTTRIDTEYKRYDEEKAALGVYTINQQYGREPGTCILYADPAITFERRDYSGDPLYQTLRSELVSIIANRTSNKVNHTSLSTVFKPSSYYPSLDSFENMLDNLEIDLMKEGYIDYIDICLSDVLNHAPWFGEFDWFNENIGVGVEICYDYRNTDYFLGYESEIAQREAELLTKHPELSPLLARLKQN